jgi:hypothetical protein
VDLGQNKTTSHRPEHCSSFAMVRRVASPEVTVEDDPDVGSASLDWSEQPVDILKGTELEWSTITAASRANRAKLKCCLFCGRSYAGGAVHIREHLDGSIRPRHVSAPLIVSGLICVQHRACQPSPQWIDRHAEVVQLIQSKVVSVAEAELLKSKAAQARAKSSSHSATTIDSALMSRPTPDQVACSASGCEHSWR